MAESLSAAGWWGGWCGVSLVGGTQCWVKSWILMSYQDNEGVPGASPPAGEQG